MNLKYVHRIIFAALCALFVLALAPSALHAQNNGQDAGDTELADDDSIAYRSLTTSSYSSFTSSQNQAIADAAFATLQNREARPAALVPHLDPIKVRNAMTSLTYVGRFSFVIGHRGYHTAPGCPENTACALAAAYDAGADAVEFDVKSTSDKGVVFGHDYTLGREQSNWLGKSGTTQWNFFANYPGPDRAYTAASKLGAFGIQLEGSNNPGVNDKRASISEANQVGSPYSMRDTFGTVVPNLYEMNVYQYLYMAQRYLPLMPWLDIKSLADLKNTALSVIAAQQDFDTASWNKFPSGGPVHAVAFKLGPNVLLGKSTDSPAFSSRVGYNGGSVRSVTGIADASYFFVFGTGDLDQLAGYGQTLSSCNGACTAANAAIAGFNDICQVSQGCLGAELSHKYVNAPTQSLYNLIKAELKAKVENGITNGIQLASFATPPQFEWYWQTLSQPEQLATVPFSNLNGTVSNFSSYGAWYGRTDGSCCFTLLDPNLLNTSIAFGSEYGDWRADTPFNVSNFTTITTDESGSILRYLNSAGKRPSALATALLPTGSSYPQGTDLGILPDGLYEIVNLGQAGQIMEPSGNTNGVAVVSSQKQYSSLEAWYLAYQGQGIYSINNASSNQLLTAIAPTTGSGSNTIQPYYQGGNQTLQQWALNPTPNGAYVISNVSTGAVLDDVNASQPIVNNSPNGGPTQRWLLEPIAPPTTKLSSAVTGSTLGTASINVPGAPTDLTTLLTPNSITVQWQKPAFTANATLSYTLEITSPSNAVTSYSGLSLGTNGVGSQQITNLQAGSTYKISLKALAGSNVGPVATATVVTPPISSVNFSPYTSVTFTQCASENATCYGTDSPNLIGIGANNSFDYQYFPGDFLCGRYSGVDAAPGVVKQCVIVGNVPPPPANATNSNYCGVENSTCYVNGLTNVVIWFGANGSFTSKNASGNTSCTIASFGNTDPAPGVIKYCYYSAAPKPTVPSKVGGIHTQSLSLPFCTSYLGTDFIDWAPPSSNGGSPITGYKIVSTGLVSNNSQTLAATAQSTTVPVYFQLFGFNWGTVTISAINAVGEGPTLTVPLVCNQ